MKIEECVIEGNMVAVTAPFTRTEPEKEWVDARDAGAIPVEIFSLYERAGFLSFGLAPSFLYDNKNLLFGYFSMILESVKGSLVDADQEMNGFQTANGMIFDPGKGERGEPWDKTADNRAKNHFRMF